jgi:hypothetical protein
MFVVIGFIAGKGKTEMSSKVQRVCLNVPKLYLNTTIKIEDGGVAYFPVNSNFIQSVSVRWEDDLVTVLAIKISGTDKRKISPKWHR